MGVSGWMFLLVPAYPGCPGQTAVKWLLLLLLLLVISNVSNLTRWGDNTVNMWWKCFSTVCLCPSVLWRCWLGGRKGIQPVKKLSGKVLVWLSVWSKVHTCIWPSWCHCLSLSLASVKSRLVLPLWYRLTRVVSEKKPLNGCVCACMFTHRLCVITTLKEWLKLHNI